MFTSICDVFEVFQSVFNFKNWQEVTQSVISDCAL